MQIKKNKSIRKPDSKLAFSLFELSIVIIVIATLMLGVFQGGIIFNKVKVSSAAALTRSSVVGKMDGLIAWFETTMPTSFSNIQASDGVTVTTWFNNANPLKANNAVGSAIYKAGSINGLPTLRFEGGQYFLVDNGQNLDQLTIFVVMKFDAGSSGSNTIMNSQGAWQSGSLHLLLSSTGGNAQYSVNAASDFINTNISITDNKPHIITYIDDNILTKYIYIDGANLANTTTSSTTKSFTNYTIGSWYQASNNISRYLSGNIAEIIIFNRVISDQERQDVEAYLNKKWAIF